MSNKKIFLIIFTLPVLLFSLVSGAASFVVQNPSYENLFNSGQTLKKDSVDYQDVIKKIASDIESMKNDYPQLIDFSAEKDISLSSLYIDYSYKTHKSTIKAGWRSGVPEPDDDGIWLYLNFHSANSDAQIDTQPIMPFCMKIGSKYITMLILEGDKTKPVYGKIMEILKKYGVSDC